MYLRLPRSAPRGAVLSILSLMSAVLPTRGAAVIPHPATVVVHCTPDGLRNSFRPRYQFGADVDGQQKGDIVRMHTPRNTASMLKAGFGALSYRLRTELAMEAWHWNPAGTWSDPKRRQGYWTSDPVPVAPIRVSNGYRLPHRGNTIDQANNDGYSRIDDGDETSYWKSNPYLDPHYTHASADAHPQWVVIDLRQRRPVDTARIVWGAPYAVRYTVEYWEGEDPAEINDEVDGRWRAFPAGQIAGGTGGAVTLSLTGGPKSTRFLRILLFVSSHTGPPDDPDVRSKLGFAIRELYVGTRSKTSALRDAIKHAPRSSTQTIVYTSSTDPWHRAGDFDANVEQPGIDLVFQSDLARGVPVMVPVATLYDTPENAANEIRYLKSRRYPVKQIEIGEEPDGQYCTPENYGALYCQWCDAVHAVDPLLEPGGPGFQTNVEDYLTWPDRYGNALWMSRFLSYLARRHRTRDYRFFSFEWYPFDDVCRPTAPQIAAAGGMLTHILGRLRAAGLSMSVPRIISEYGYSSFAGQPEVDMAGALLNADIVCRFFTLGGKAAYFYGYEPNVLIREARACDTWGNLTLFLTNAAGQITQPVAAYYGARMLTQYWTIPGAGVHRLYAASSPVHNAAGQELVSAYPVLRPDGTWSVMLINKDPAHAWPVRIRFAGGGAALRFQGPIKLTQYSARQYRWHAARKYGHADPDLPPSEVTLGGDPAFVLPPYSLSVATGNIY